MAIEGSYNFRRVNDQVTTSGAVEASHLEHLASEGYEAVINLLPDDSEDSLANESSIVEAQGVQYFHIPVDFSAPNESDYSEFSRTLDGLFEKKIHIHCAANFRVSAFYSLYALRTKAWTQKQANEFISSIWNPSDYPGWPELIERVSQSDS